jgi:hypothetical protein
MIQWPETLLVTNGVSQLLDRHIDLAEGDQIGLGVVAMVMSLVLDRDLILTPDLLYHQTPIDPVMILTLAFPDFPVI